MKILIREYKPTDKIVLIRCVEALQDYEINIDNLKRKRRLPAYGKYFTNQLLRRVRTEKGKIFLAVDQDKVCGYVVGTVAKQTKESLLKKVPSKFGYVVELYVDQSLRRQRVGQKLMKKMEEFFEKEHCTVITVGAMVVNTGARKFYKKLKYVDRSVEMIKII
ncbi:MAG: GNAT family N-acetyltransferase [Patescibacteria group bacterium]|mgnify:FL=1